MTSPSGEVEGPVDREPGLVIALPERDLDVELPEFGSPLIIGQSVQALPFSQEARVETLHSFGHLRCVPLLVPELGQFLLRRLSLGRERVDLGDDGGRVVKELEVLDEPRFLCHQVVVVLLTLGDASSEGVVGLLLELLADPVGMAKHLLYQAPHRAVELFGSHGAPLATPGLLAAVVG